MNLFSEEIPLKRRQDPLLQFFMSMLHNAGWGVLCVDEEQIGRSHSAGIAREKKGVDKIRGGVSPQVLVPVSGSPHAGKKGDRTPFPDPSAIFSKGALRK